MGAGSGGFSFVRSFGFAIAASGIISGEEGFGSSVAGIDVFAASGIGELEEDSVGSSASSTGALSSFGELPGSGDSGCSFGCPVTAGFGSEEMGATSGSMITVSAAGSDGEGD